MTRVINEVRDAVLAKLTQAPVVEKPKKKTKAVDKVFSGIKSNKKK